MSIDTIDTINGTEVMYQRATIEPRTNGQQQQPNRKRETLTGFNPDARIWVPSDDNFGDQPYLEGQQAQEVGRAIIDKRPALHFLGGAAIRYLWQRKGPKAGPLGTLTRPGNLTRYLGSTDYVVVLYADRIRDNHLTNWHFEALLTNLLLHAEMDDKGKFSTRGPAIAAFHEEVSWYGNWTRDLKWAAKTFRQAEMAGMADD